ncbi:MAG: hypothetical protein U0610_17395 [bacterium]
MTVRSDRALASSSRGLRWPALLAFVITLGLPLGVGATTGPVKLGDPAGNPGSVHVVKASKHDMTKPLRTMTIVPVRPRNHEMEPERTRRPLGTTQTPDAALQTSIPSTGKTMPSAALEFEGMSDATAGCNCTPPDTNGEIGPHHFVQMVNSALQVFDRTGTSVWGPADINTIWAGFGGSCETENAGDPVVVYDQLADRWVISQFTDSTAPYYECVAVSATGDPSGSWYRYAFQTSTTKFNDYPKLGVWPDGYYMSANLFIGNSWAGTGAYVMDRASMLTGAAATMQFFELPVSDWGGMLPSDIDGFALPPSGAVNVFAEVVDGAWDPVNWPNDELQFHQFHVDWATPANTTFNSSPIQLAVSTFDGLLCSFAECVPQQTVAQKLDTLSDRLMFRLAYRNFGDHEALVLNHTVDAGSDRSAIRWYEIRNPRANPPTIYQQSTFAPGSLHRWMGSIAMDSEGDIALGYSGSSASQHPDLRFTGRLVSDSLNSLPQGETVFLTSARSQFGASRWGDYSDLTIDPRNDCTFWYTHEYVDPTTGSAFSWHTRVASFTYPSCTTIFRDSFEIGATSYWDSAIP